MKRRSHYVLALTLLATTLCAGRLFASDQATRVETRQPVEKLVTRLTRSFRQVVPQNLLVQQQRITNPLPTPLVLVSTHGSFDRLLSPFQFRLPPPAV